MEKYCPYCGNPIADEVGQCPTCGAALTSTPPQPLPAAVRSVPRMTVAGFVWCAVCLAANLALAIIGIVVLSNRGGDSFAGVAAIVAAFVAAFGFTMLLFTNREGFYVVCLAAAVGILMNFLSGNIINAIFGIVNPVITWLFIKFSWERMGQPFETPRSRRTALVLACIPCTGFLGFDRFYLGYGWKGFFKAITYSGLLIWYVIDIVKLAMGKTRDGFGTPLCERRDPPAQAQPKQDKAKTLRIWGIVLIAVGVIAGVVGSLQPASDGSSTAGSYIMGPLIFGGVGLFLLLKGLKRPVKK